ncbi:DNA-directed DNA polymerase II large subunit [Methanogenium sp. S4BF]|uniref:DNA-directed DNA polymerase II large subunit n=1 Tax=Methanogenium sp. S4BF TaxID=1789226 RepID=UPI0024178B86|nr:DNA-directed DNA polymerase II large subunit [Methanogenium sp. S4BF]WFN34561.1 DNA-directed DNA polymerase II large subunit [Methanogenium sp. S4BF]
MHASPEMEAYFAGLEAKLKEAIGVANEARAKGIDPRTAVEIPVANDLADRVEALLGYTGVAARLRELAETMPREEVALKIGDDFIAHMFGETTREETLDHAIRTSMALLTEGVVAAPTEGIAKVGIGKNDDGTDYLKIYYAGPIRSAGGTAQALSVLVGDYVRRGLGMAAYIPRKEEVERYVEEIKKYNSQVSLQYLPTDDELRVIIRNCPVCVEGEPTERVEVSGYRNLERIETNTVRGGMALVVAEGLALKAPKIKKTVDKVRMEGWDWLDIIISGASKSKDDDDDGEEKKPGVKPKDKYIRDLIAGRPVFSYPMRAGGFRLRYGRSRNTGFAAAGFSPATLHLLGNFLAVGTQMKVERPGKAAGVVPVDSIEGPTVKLEDGSVLRIDDAETAVRLMSKVEEILDVGEMLVSYGEFLENNHPLIPPTYCEEWWRLDGGTHTPADETEAIGMACAGGYLHPAYTYIWDDLTAAEVRALADWVAAAGSITAEGLTLPADAPEKRHLEILLVPHTVTNGVILISAPKVLCACLGLTADLKTRSEWESAPDADGLSLAMHLSGLQMRSRAGIRIGGRMGRPGKSKAREMRPPPHAIFPVGDEGGSRRSFQEASKGKGNRDGTIHADVGRRRCPSCGEETYKCICSECGTHTEAVFTCPRCARDLRDETTCPVCGAEGVCLQKEEINVKEEYARALTALGMRPNEVELLKGVRGLISKERTVEPIEKGILRAKNGLYVFKDGTLRYDMIDLPLTHIRPNEIGVSVERLVELGYPQDIDGVPLTSPDQVLELRAQDILVSEDCAGWLLRVAKFIDEMLEKLYGMPPYYNAKTREDIVGQLVMGLAPHTSAGVLARVIGVSKAPVGYAHPYFHAAKRRNCFAADTMIDVYDGAEWRSLPIGHFVVENFDLDRPGLDQVGTYYSDPKAAFWVHALDTGGMIHLQKVTSVSVHRAPDHLIRFTTSRGKHVTVTSDHAMLVSDFAYQRKVRAVELNEGDCVPVFEGQMMITDTIQAKEYIPNFGEYVYCLTVAEDHTLAANGIFTGQCDGDEDCVMLLMDGLVNFSRSFLPETRGGSMDAPLVLTTKLDPAEVDGESHNVDACRSYPIELYEAALQYRHPKELSKIIDHLENRLGTPGQYEGVGFTHDTSNISAGPLLSTYTTLTTMSDKLEAEFELGRIIRAVDEDDVAERVLKTHFIPDMQGNLNAFSRQKLRCPTCNTKYRRMPMAGKCRCGGKIIQTVHEGSVKKYIDMSRKICTDYDISEYTRQRIEMLDMYLVSTFGEEKEIQLGLADFM